MPKSLLFKVLPDHFDIEKVQIQLLYNMMFSMENTRYELNLYIIPSPRGISWDSPYNLTISGICNHLTFKDRNIGHVNIELKKIVNDELLIHELTGMVGVNMQNTKKVLLEGYGLGTIFHNYQGRLEEKEDLLKELKQKAASKRLNFINFQISEKSFNQTLRYLEEYRQNKPYYYGLPNRPRYGEGAGCSAFATSFLEVAGIMEDEFIQKWSKKVLVPKEIIGGSFNPQLKVSIIKLLFSPSYRKWAKNDDDHQEIFFWDPDQMFHWVNEKLKSTPCEKITSFRHSQGVILDKTNCDPEEKIWLT